MKEFIFRSIAAASILCFLSIPGNGHTGGHTVSGSEIYLLNGKPVSGHVLMCRNDSIFLEQADGHITGWPLSRFDGVSQRPLRETKARLARLNQSAHTADRFFRNSPNARAFGLLTGWCCLVLISLRYFRLTGINRLLLTGGSLVVLYACKTSNTGTPTPVPVTGSDPAVIDKVFAPFKPQVSTRYDNTYFYVESTGMPDHPMMTGITSWQQQVPVPQNYTGTNAWSIPLKPELATSPLSLKTNFMKGAVAIAPNGIPVFNPLNNRGEDAFAIGELDQWGGHCGRADDYHYHIVPLHFEKTAGSNPIAMALDGFAIYGSKEPDGRPMQPLDEYHGHMLNNTYHYHATTTYPYFMAAMRGKVMVDPATAAPENQIIPQARTTAIRPAGEPLRGAAITGFTSVSVNAWSLEYTLAGQKGFVNYRWDDKGVYTFTFISPDGKTTTASYVKK
ncbi:YHYH protein [Arsenicibacter rosenii]|uniref:YHYH domain-containing protein n=1 Tax=Arsenicibacter rosenii TaxID=1750698 RepID=A0A1S2VPL3_9BACT|nr:YHYH protein [Arsenicibacter rosenii]OIN60692.1 hypothetical protein BLX24_00835 [Arsenicibacter rosenii]